MITHGEDHAIDGLEDTLQLSIRGIEPTGRPWQIFKDSSQQADALQVKLGFRSGACIS